MRRKLGTSLNPPVLFCFLLVSLVGTETLEVKVSDSPVKVVKEQDVFIPCTISGYGSTELDLQLLSVHWSRGSDPVYIYDRGSPNPIRTGSELDVRLIKGNAGLYLPQVQVTDDGQYTCTVTYNNEGAEGTSSLEVSVKPSARLVPPDVIIEEGTERGVTCHANNYYPEMIKFQWIKQLSLIQYDVLHQGVSTNEPLENEDGTFNVTSQLMLKPSLGHDGKKYSCIISHRSLENDLVLYFTLSVKVSHIKIAGAVLGTLGVLILASCVWGYIIFVKKEPPKLSEITGAEYLVHMDKATLSCQISGYRPNPIHICIYLRRKGGELMEIYSWKSDPQTGPSAPQDTEGHNTTEMEELLRNGDMDKLLPELRPLKIHLFPDVKSSQKRISICQCTIHITPNIEEDDGAELTVRVTHSALRLPISESCRLKVRGVPPKLSTIVSPLRILHDEPLILTCPINGFKPKPLLVTWLKVDPRGRETELLSWDQGTININDPKYSHQLQNTEHEDCTNNYLSFLSLKPTVKEDANAKYICRTNHYATESLEQESMEMMVSAVPELDPIQKSAEILYVGEEMTLSCRIHSFHPQTLGFSWYEEDEMLESHNETINSDNHGLFYCTSRTTYSPCVRDIGKKFRCEVSHPTLQNPKCVFWELKHLMSEPRVSAIKCDPEVPGCNQTTTLSCTIEKFYPKDLKIRWYRGLEVIKSESDPEGAKEDPESGLFSRTTEIQITPTFNDHGKEFHMEIIHNMKIYKKKFCLELKGFPQAKEIICSNLSPKYGEPLTLSCEVSGCNGRDVTAEWQMGNDPITRGTRTETPTNGDSVSFLLTLTPTAEHYGKLLTCLVKHKDLPQLIKKNISLKLPDVAPTLSEIVVSQKVLQINRETSFTVTISSFSQKNLKVKWYRSFMPLTANIVTTEPQIGGDRLYCCTSTLRYTPTKSNIGMSIRCEVTANKETREKRFQFTLASGDELDGRNQPEPISEVELDGRNQPEPISEVEMDGRNEPEPTPDRGGQEITDIECVTPNPRKGQSLTLQCKIKGQDVEHGDFSWSDGIFPIDESLIDNSNLTDGSGCISKVTFTPDEDDGEIRFEATFNLVTTERTYQLPWV